MQKEYKKKLVFFAMSPRRNAYLHMLRLKSQLDININSIH